MLAVAALADDASAPAPRAVAAATPAPIAASLVVLRENMLLPFQVYAWVGPSPSLTVPEKQACYL